MRLPRVKTAPLVLIAVLFLGWAGVFIFKTSFIAIDGERHFCLFDDAMISMRYAWNLSHGEGLVWNEGERVEGFTNMLMTLLMALATLIFSKGGAVLAVQVFGAFTMLAVGFLTMKIGETIVRHRKRDPGVFFPVIFFTGGLLFYPLAYWSLMGMETGLLAALLLAAVWVAMRSSGRAQPATVFSVLAGLAFWTRPDAAVYILLIYIYRVATIPRSRERFRIISREVGITALFVVAISVFRLAYYGEIVPNTYTLKMSGIPLLFRIENGLGFIGQFFAAAWLPLTLAAVCFVLTASGPAALFIALIAASFAYQIYVGGDPWLYWRMVAPFMPLVFVLVLQTVAAPPRYLGGFPKVSSRAAAGIQVAAALIALVLITVTVNSSFENEMVFKELPYQVDFNHATVSAALAINEVTEESATLGVLWAGSLPYYTDLRAIDFLGKTNTHIASLPPDLSGKVGWRGMKSVPGHNKYDLQYSVVELRPTYVQDTRWGRDDVLGFLRENYRGVRYKGVPLMLERGSPHVKWDVIAKGPKRNPHGVPLQRSSSSPLP